MFIVVIQFSRDVSLHNPSMRRSLSDETHIVVSKRSLSFVTITSCSHITIGRYIASDRISGYFECPPDLKRGLRNH